MRTWLPVANVTESAKALHDEDLRTQIVDAGLALRALAEHQDGLVCRMWTGYEGGLLAYFLRLCHELEYRGVSAEHFIRRGWKLFGVAGFDVRPLMPRWFGYRPIHLSHASTLMRQRPTHYARLWPQVPLDMPLLWPRNTDGRFDFSITLSTTDRAAMLRGDLVLGLGTARLTELIVDPKGWL